MKRCLIIAALLVACACRPAQAAIAFVSAASNAATPVSTITVTTAVTAGNTVVLIVCIKGGTVTSVTSVPAQTWTFQVQRTGPVLGFRTELWTSPLSPAAVTSVTANASVGDDMIALTSEYSGVAAFGTTSTANGTAATLTLTLTTQDANNFVVGGVQTDGSAISTTTGIQRATNTVAAGETGAVSDNTAATASAVSIIWSLTENTEANAVAVELRSTTGAAPGGFNKRRKLDRLGVS